MNIKNFKIMTLSILSMSQVAHVKSMNDEIIKKMQKKYIKNIPDFRDNQRNFYYYTVELEEKNLEKIEKIANNLNVFTVKEWQDKKIIKHKNPEYHFTLSKKEEELPSSEEEYSCIINKRFEQLIKQIIRTNSKNIKVFKPDISYPSEGDWGFMGLQLNDDTSIGHEMPVSSAHIGLLKLMQKKTQYNLEENFINTGFNGLNSIKIEIYNNIRDNICGYYLAEDLTCFIKTIEKVSQSLMHRGLFFYFSLNSLNDLKDNEYKMKNFILSFNLGLKTKLGFQTFSIEKLEANFHKGEIEIQKYIEESTNNVIKHMECIRDVIQPYIQTGNIRREAIDGLIIEEAGILISKLNEFFKDMIETVEYIEEDIGEIKSLCISHKCKKKFSKIKENILSIFTTLQRDLQKKTQDHIEQRKNRIIMGIKWKYLDDLVDKTFFPTEPEVSAVKPEVSAVKPEVSAVKPEVSALTPEVSALKPEVSALKPEVSDLKYTFLDNIDRDKEIEKENLKIIKVYNECIKNHESSQAIKQKINTMLDCVVNAIIEKDSVFNSFWDNKRNKNLPTPETMISEILDCIRKNIHISLSEDIRQEIFKEIRKNVYVYFNYEGPLKKYFNPNKTNNKTKCKKIKTKNKIIPFFTFNDKKQGFKKIAKNHLIKKIKPLLEEETNAIRERKTLIAETQKNIDLHCPKMQNKEIIHEQSEEK